MRLPVIPLIVAATILMAAVYLFNASKSDHLVLDVPKLTRIADIDGTETEVAIAPDGNRYAVIVDGDLWTLDTSNSNRQQTTKTPELESFPAWSPDGKQITFTRGPNTFTYNVESKTEQVLRTDATSLSWSTTSRTTFVRDRALWITNPNGLSERKLVDADPNEDITIRAPRFSLDSLQIAFIKSQLGLRAEVWLVDVLNGMSRPLVADRPTENPLDVGWTLDNQHVLYLTNRAGAYSLWQVDLAESQILPLTQPLVTIPLSRIGMAVWKDRIVLPRHFLDSNIVLSDGTPVASTEKLELEPAVSPDQKLVAYTLADENRIEVWTVGLDGKNATFRTLGREPRFAANGYELVYTHTDPIGNDDIWDIDLRNGKAEPLTDADEIDVAPDWSPDGRSIAFSSARGGPVSIWTVPASGGKRLKLNESGYAPRYSSDSKSILFWTKQGLWTVDTDGKNPREVFTNISDPTQAVWTSKGPAAYFNGAIRTASEILLTAAGDHPLWPRFDLLRDGRFVTARIDIRETGLWAVDLTYKEQ